MRAVTASAFLALALAATPARAAEPGAIGQVKTVSGSVWLVRDGNRLAARVGDALLERDVLETGTDGKVGVTLADNTMLSAGPGSRLGVEAFRFDSAALKGNLLANMERGTLAVVTGDVARSAPDAMKIKTPTAVLGVRGTEFLVRAGGR